MPPILMNSERWMPLHAGCTPRIGAPNAIMFWQSGTVVVARLPLSLRRATALVLCPSLLGAS